jgi:hypothetical protein
LKIGIGRCLGCASEESSNAVTSVNYNGWHAIIDLCSSLAISRSIVTFSHSISNGNLIFRPQKTARGTPIDWTIGAVVFAASGGVISTASSPPAGAASAASHLSLSAASSNHVAPSHHWGVLVLPAWLMTLLPVLGLVSALLACYIHSGQRDSVYRRYETSLSVHPSFSKLLCSVLTGGFHARFRAE